MPCRSADLQVRLRAFTCALDHERTWRSALRGGALPIGIGGSLAAAPLPHHRTYGSVSGGSMDYAGLGVATEAKPSDPRRRVGNAMASAGLFASRQGPC